MSEPCKTCRHWKPPTQRTNFRNAIGLVHEDWRHANEQTNAADRLYGECTAIDIQQEWPVDKPLPLATTCDASEYEATLYTQAEFGCRMHEPTPDAPPRPASRESEQAAAGAGS